MQEGGWRIIFVQESQRRSRGREEDVERRRGREGRRFPPPRPPYLRTCAFKREEEGKRHAMLKNDAALDT